MIHQVTTEQKKGMFSYSSSPINSLWTSLALMESSSFKQIHSRLLNIKPVCRKTNSWLFSKPEYNECIERKAFKIHNILWIKGKPGSGKSTIMKEALRRTKRKLPGALIVSYFSNARAADRLEKTPLGMYRSLCHQMLKGVPHPQGHFLTTFSSRMGFEESDPEY